MVDVTDDAASQREAHRQPTGQFGAIPHQRPEFELTVYDPEILAGLQKLVEDAREWMSTALIHKIDATMPAVADLVNYEFAPDGTHLVVKDAMGEMGEDLDTKEFAHIDDALRELGQPYADFDGDLLVNSIDEMGWERTELWSQERDEAAREAADVALAHWNEQLSKQQTAALNAMWQFVGEDVEALDFSWDNFAKSLKLEAVIHSGGRTNLRGRTSPAWSNCNSLAEYILAPERTHLQRNDLTGNYRLTR